MSSNQSMVDPPPPSYEEAVASDKNDSKAGEIVYPTKQHQQSNPNNNNTHTTNTTTDTNIKNNNNVNNSNKNNSNSAAKNPYCGVFGCKIASLGQCYNCSMYLCPK